MPEIMSAEKFATDWLSGDLSDTYYMEHAPLTDAIQSRDFAIIEKCKEAMEALDFHEAGYYDVCRALDSVLSDINGGK